ncbi:MAG: hypothetical protein KAH84_00710 [Thiomargarita sp.]|nr:hypothetical protein [Thiomargarita sp.]
MKTKHLIYIFMLIAGSLGATKAYIDYQLQLELNKNIQKMASIATIEYETAKLTLTGAVQIFNINIISSDYLPIHIDKIILYRAYQFLLQEQLPEQINLVITGINIPVKQIETIPPLVSIFGYKSYYITLNELDYKNISANIKLNSQQKQSDNFTQIIIDVPIIGKYILNTHLNNMDLPININKIQLQQGQLTYIANKKFIQRLFSKLAQRNKQTISQLKQNLTNKLKNDLQIITKSDDSLIANLQRFIQLPNQLIIALQPKKAFTINKFPLTSVSNLGLKITTTNSK